MEKVADFKKPAFSVTDVFMILTDKKVLRIPTVSASMEKKKTARHIL